MPPTRPSLRRRPHRLPFLLLFLTLALPCESWAASIPAAKRDSVVVFNEIHYHPAGDDLSLEYIELYNQLAVDVDLSNWRIGGINYNFPERTKIRGRSYLVVARNPAALRAATGYAGALGPFPGSLSNSGETLRLFNQLISFSTSRDATGSRGEVTDSLEGRRIMDEIDFADAHPWPAGPDGSGATLAKINPATGTPHPTNWATSRQQNGTPGAANTFPTVPSLAFNEVSATTDHVFRVELHNYDSTPVAYGGMLIASSDSNQEPYTLPPGNLAAGSYLSIDTVALGFTPADNNRLFLYSPGKVALIDAVRTDDRPLARHPDGTGRWLRPNLATFGGSNSFSFTDDVVINEIFYHAYPQRESPGTPPTTNDVPVIEFDATWRFEENAGTAGLLADWATLAHPAWPGGQALLARESSTLGEPVHTNIELAPPTITYYFETEFVNPGGEVEELVVEHYVDDGAVFYLNGVELGRFNMPEGEITPTTPASPGVADAALESFTVATPNLLNGTNRLSVEVHQSSANSNDVVFGARVSIRTGTLSGNPPLPYAERDEEWIELYNRGPDPVDLTGWKFSGGIDYDLPDSTSIPAGGYLVIAKDAAALTAKHPGATIIGDYSNRLGNGGDLIVLEDPHGNPADEVVYYDSGHWHDAADGGGSSLELRDPESDNAVASSWAPSDETGRSRWQTYTYEGVAEDDGQGNNVFHEFLLGLLDAGELLLDDVSVIEDPGGRSIEFMQNGDFERDRPGVNPASWRCVGTHGSHGRTVVVVDPDNPGNRCLHVVATGPTEDKHNKIETTFANGERVVVGNTYQITFRAKWLRGSNQVNTRLYFSYLQQTNLLEVPEVWGTPGEPNTTRIANAGPALTEFQHQPVVPEPNQDVNVFARATDPDGISRMRVFYSVNAGDFQSVPMSDTGNGLYRGTIPRQSASRIIRFYVHAEDSAAGVSFFPPAGPGGGAFYKVQDGFADTSGLRHNFRIVMAEADRNFLFLNTNRMSNDRFPVTVIEDEETAYYDVGLRLKASGFGRYNSGHYGFNVQFQPDHLFRGAHETVSVERSPNLKEVLAKYLTNRAGAVYSSQYDDVAYIITPTTGDRGIGLLAPTRQTASYFDALFPNVEEPGTLFNHELLYNPNGTAGGPEGLKINNPYNHTGGRYELRDRGDDKEPYRWGFQIRSARGRDDYSRMVALNQAIGNLSGPALKEALDPLIDVNQWMRSFAIMSLNGTDDIYGRIWEHNFRYYSRPTDGKFMVFQWDLDRSFNLASSASLPPGNNVGKLFRIPEYRRLFDAHLLDLIETTFNSSYMTTWASHLGTLTGDGLSGLTSYVTSRASYVLSQLPRETSFRITTNGGSDFSEADSVVMIEGDAWIDVFSIRVNGVPVPLTWTDGNNWRVTVPLAIGENLLTITGINHRGTEVASDTITVTNTSAVGLANADNTQISQLHYHPAPPSAAEVNAGYLDQEWFEFIELTNTSAMEIDLTGCTFTDGVNFTFPNRSTLAPGARLVIVANQAAFEQRYGAGIATIAGTYLGNLRNSGERVRLQAADASTIADFTYRDAAPWPESADGAGYSLVFNGADPADPLGWRSSATLGGSPGSGGNSIPFTGSADDLLPYALAGPPTVGFDSGEFTLVVPLNLLADDAFLTAEFSGDLLVWTPATALELKSRLNHGNGTETLIFTSPLPPGNYLRQFARVRAELR